MAAESTTKGWTADCIRGAHGLCTTFGARCSCPCHGTRGQQPPRPKETPRPMPSPARPLTAVPASTTRVRQAPSIKLVKADPPAKLTGRTSPIAPLLEECLAGVRAEPGEWFQIGTWPGKSSAGGWLKKLRTLHTDIQFRAARHGEGSALYAKATAAK